MSDDIFIEDDNSVELEGEALERVQQAEEARHAKIEAIWDQIPAEKQRILTFIHNKIMAGKFDGPNPHNHITFLNQTRDLHMREVRRRVNSKGATYDA